MTTTPQRILTPRPVTLPRAETSRRDGSKHFRRTFSSLSVVAVALLSIVGTPRTAHAYLIGPSPGAFVGLGHALVAGLATVAATPYLIANGYQIGKNEPFSWGYSVTQAGVGVAILGATIDIARSKYADPGIVALMATEGALLITIPIAEWAFRGPDPSAVSLRLTPGGASLSGAF